MPAQYFCSGEQAQEEWHHYGLAAPIYTHFTSPIRRYADVCVHRLLGAAIGVSPLPTFLMDKVRAGFWRPRKGHDTRVLQMPYRVRQEVRASSLPN